MSNPIKDKKVADELVVHSMYDMAKEITSLKDEHAVVEWAANTVMTSAMEYGLAIDEVLVSQFGFTPIMIDELHMYLGEFLRGLGEVHSYGNHPMTPEDMKVVGEIARLKAPLEKALVLKKKLGIALPSNLKMKELLS